MNDPARTEVDPIPNAIEPERFRLYLTLRGVAKGLLFILTIPTTVLAGAILFGESPAFDAALLQSGVEYSVALLSVIAAHAGAHYFVARHHGLRPALPWVIPGLPVGAGTSGFIDNLPTNVSSQKACVQIALAGPAASALISAVLAASWMSSCEIVQTCLEGDHFEFGEPLLFKMLAYLIVGPLGSEADMILGPVGFAAWVGMFWTAIHLIPIEPLDGGHLVRAAFGGRTRTLTLFTLIVLSVAGFALSFTWLSLAICLALGLATRRWTPTLYALLFWRRPNEGWEPTTADLEKKDLYLLIALALILFVLCVAPVPISFQPA